MEIITPTVWESTVNVREAWNSWADGVEAHTSVYVYWDITYTEITVVMLSLAAHTLQGIAEF